MSDHGSTRRAFGRGTIDSVLTFCLLEHLCLHDAFGKGVQPITARWLKQVDDVSRSVRAGKIEQVQWQKQAEALFAQVSLPDLLKFIDYQKLSANVQFREKGERSMRVRFPSVEGLPTGLAFGQQVFALKKNQSVVPHGHNNMATAFIILEGSFHGRHYDRIEDEKRHMIVKPTIDDTFRPGQYTTISDHKDNVHWFKAVTDRAFIFNIHVLNIDAQVKKGGRVYIDPDGEKISGGRIRAPRVTYKQAHEKYG
ncbi:MAG: hypothetical protein OER86_02080 [Phycisphaerae bacterium]|nr:hypothetical protein [Phycisphaerae bacterium]